MTLFRKVFQAQARAASAKDVIDEEALRAAFNESEASGNPLVLDPFEHALKTETSTSDEYEDEDELLEDLSDYLSDDDNTEYAESVLEDDTESATKTHDAVAEEAEAAEAAADEDQAAPIDEDICAFVGRAMAADDARVTCVETTRFDEPVDDEACATNEAQQGAQEAPDENAEDAMQCDDGDVEEIALAGEDEDDLESDDAISAIFEEEPEPASTSPVVQQPDENAKSAGKTETDVAHFAQQQMAAMGDKTEASAAPIDQASPLSKDSSVPDVAGLAAVPAPAAGRSARRAGRVKTRLLGFNRSAGDSNDPFGERQETTAAPELNKFPVGWLVIVDGPGEGHSFSIFAGASTIGRGDDQGICLDFGDNSISRSNHAAVAYDNEENKFYIGHGGKSNIIRRNARPVLSTEELHHADLIRIGETTLRFVALCGSDFRWSSAGGHDETGV